jgi:hypothetical protein
VAEYFFQKFLPLALLEWGKNKNKRKILEKCVINKIYL